MNLQDGDHFDAIVIGAGMSGLAAAIRLSLFDKKVLVLERHNVIGGLNSFYSFNGIKYDVGLHALTNFSTPDSKGSPLSFLLRQLRIKREEWNLSEQLGSQVAFPNITLNFSNNEALFESEIAQHFPKEIDGFRKLSQKVREEFGNVPPDIETTPSREIIKEFIQDPLLTDMILLPVMDYGSSQEHDLDWVQFVNLFQSVYLEGFARPFEGVRVILKTLREKLKTYGGIRKMKAGVSEILTQNGEVCGVKLDSGIELKTNQIISSIGYPETVSLCTEKTELHPQNHNARISFVETIRVLNCQPQDLGWDRTIIFFNDSETLNYSRPEEPIDTHSGVICFPNNYDYDNEAQLDHGYFRISALANFDKWVDLDEATYIDQKQLWGKKLETSALNFLPQVDPKKLSNATIAEDMFTPRTIRKYTNHFNGAVYGVPGKQRTGHTHIKNLFICGTDHGMLGITGSMISGITVANNCVLKPALA